jgi:methylated-DNA-[protein]-cysteine S-methyltransferase
MKLPDGTPFQQKVWKALLTIPHGETRTYAQIANQVGHPKAARAVGSACRANPMPIKIPCHRVIPSNGKIGNYSYGGPDVKRKLLKREGALPI